MSSSLRKAIFYIIIASLCFTIMNSIVRFVNHLPTFELVFFRSIGSAILGSLILKVKKVSVWGTHRKLLWTRAILGVISMSFFFQALRMMPIGTAVSLRYLAPIFAAVFAVFFLKEKIKRWQWFFFATAFIGVILIKGFDPRITMNGLLVILTCAIFSGLVYVSIRKIGDRENSFVIINYFMVCATVVGGIMCLFQWIQPQGIEWALLASLGIIGFVAQFFMTKGMQMGESNQVSPFKYSEAIFTLIVGYSFFDENQTRAALVGIAVILISLVMNVVIKQRRRIA